MRTKQVTVREGELLGPVDWDYDFTKHVYPTSTSPRHDDDRRIEQYKGVLRCVVAWLATGKSVRVRCGQFTYRALYAGMYDGWPFWEPTPAVATASPLGGVEWRFYYELSSATLVKNKPVEP